MQIQKNISLQSYNTFGIAAMARHFVSVTTTEELIQALSLKEYPDKFILGGGSNILLTKDLEALVIHVNLNGIRILEETDTHVIINAMAGENWHDFVLWCLKHDFGGIENLSLIPGNVGTAPIQNIGAYGVELKDVFVECNAIQCSNLHQKTYASTDCNFGYRDSVFKGLQKGKYVLTDVTFKLTKSPHKLNISYGAIGSELANMNIVQPTIQDVSRAVIKIRQSKLPDPKKLGNSGSFFKNPVISVDQFNTLKKMFPDITSYAISESAVKVPAGWLIEKAGFKGKRLGDFGVHNKQALVLVNYGAANGSDILKFSRLIQSTVHQLFGISLENEVNII